MKMMKKVYVFLFVVLTSAVMVSGCSNVLQPSPSNVLDMTMKYLTQQDLGLLEKYMSGNVDIKQRMKEAVLSEDVGEMKITEAQADQLIDSLLTVLKKITYTIGEETIDGDTATVSMEVSVLNGQDILAEIMTELIQQSTRAVLSGQVMSQEESTQLGIDLVTKKLNELTPTGEMVTVDVQMVKNNGIWEPSQSAVLELFVAILGINL